MKTTAIAAGAAVTGALAAKVLRKTKPLEAIGAYKWKGQTLTVWAAKEGKAGTENKHELPPPHDEVLLFGDAIVTSSAGDFAVDAWSQFYDEAFGGFEDVGSEDSEEEEDGEAEGEDVEEEDGDEEEDAEEDAEEDGDAEEEGDEEEAEEGDEDGDADEEEEEEEELEDDDCYDDGDEGGGGSKRRAPRRRTTAAPEYRRMDMGLRSRIKMPTPVGKRAPRWQTAPELQLEAYV
jgi:cobalamin biosynthesis protein CobT